MEGAMPTVRENAAGGGHGAFFGHPKGLAFIIFTEAWERFSFYGMQALMVLYMSTYLFQPGVVEKVIGFEYYTAVIGRIFGDLGIRALSAQTFGLYIGFMYLMPVLGGLAGDRLLGRRNAVLAGAVAMAVGHFLMAFEAMFLFAMAALILGSGLLKGNLAAQVGSLYEESDQRRDTAYSIYTVAINVGATIAPLVCGTLGELVGWHYGFGAAGIGMIIGTVIYVSGISYFSETEKAAKVRERSKLQREDYKKIFALVLLIVIISLYWVAQAQVWNIYPLWISDYVDLKIFGFTLPVTWFQSLDSFAVISIAPLIMIFWRKQRRRQSEPVDLSKIMLGCAIFAIADLWLAMGQLTAGSGKIAIFWPAIFHFICAVGYLYSWPAFMALFSRTAPGSVNAMMVSACYISIFIGSTTSGWLGRFYGEMSPELFWLMHGAIVACATVITWLLRGVLVSMLEEGKAIAA